MALSINGELTKLANDYYISLDSTEGKSITSSLSSLTAKLKAHFGQDLKEVIEFGSYKRDTILPRRFDEHSDVDLMIVFNHKSINVNPSTYRKYLQDFCDKYYPNSIVYKSKPTVVLELVKIKYDLVAAYQQQSGWSGSVTTYIPKSDTEWMTTDPHGFNKLLSDKNGNNKHLIKPLSRLMKAWNASAGYPIESFSLEKEIVNTGFFSSTLEEYFFSMINNMTRYRDTVSASTKVTALKDNAAKVKQALNNNNGIQAKTWLSHILPI
ncbi:MAG: nucleotidyltransferase domain-containing protein [bacterium]|nr:nucleotidyltransferase domain-containing protein [bacterium]